MIYHNPVIPGFHPDPSVCRVGDDYYLVTSSFEYFPGIPIFHSDDLIHWKQIGHCLTRNEQITLPQGSPNGTGIYAPTIRYYNGTFYVITTCVSYNENEKNPMGNFIVSTKDPYGEWSNPIWLDCKGIDPSLYFDESGKAYYCGTNGGIYLFEIDLDTGKRIGDYQYIWNGTGGCCPEGPHIYKINDWYYLFISEGGTEYAHMLTVARSRSITGPYEAYENNPVLTNRSTDRTIKATGHADIFDDQDGNWWAVCLGIRPITYPFKHNLGRETMLVPMTWNDEGWPVMGNHGVVEENIETNLLPLKKGQHCTQESEYTQAEDFSCNTLAPTWNYIYNPIPSLYQFSEDTTGITLFGNDTSLSEAKSLAFLGRRQEHFDVIVHTKLNFLTEFDKEEAGLTIYMNNQHHYEIALTRIDGCRYIILRRQIGSLWKIEQQIPYEANDVYFELQATKETYTFRYSTDEMQYFTVGAGEAKYLTTEVGGAFTGNYIGIYATGNGRACSHGANFSWFEYQGK